MMGHLADLITFANFQDDIYFQGLRFYRGRISNFLIDFCMGLTTVQRYCAACDWCGHNLNLSPLTLKTFPAMPTQMLYMCAKFH